MSSLPKNRLDEIFAGIPVAENKKVCAEEGCGKKNYGRGLCAIHWKRVRNAGNKRLDKSKSAIRHPHHKRWMAMKLRGRVDRWNKFWDFVADIGEMPSLYHKLNRMDKSQPYGPENFFWMPPAERRCQVGDDGKVVYLPYHPSQDLYRSRKTLLRKKYKMTLEQYDEMLAKQGGGCATCGEQEAVVFKRTGKGFSHAVDHDHATGLVRGVLCHLCNQAIGLMRDDPKRLRAAAEYLDRHNAGAEIINLDKAREA